MNSVAKPFAWLLIFLPVAFLLLVVFHYSETLFFADDFHLLKTIVWMQDADNLSQKFGLLVQQHNEHRILVPRLLTWLDYQLEGHIDWPALMLFGNILWCGVLYFLWDAFRTFKLNPWCFVPIPWLLFQPAYYDNYTWSISVLQQSVIVFLLAWLVHAFVNRRFGLAILIFLISTFTHGNGIFGLAVGVVFLFLYREWKWMGIWLVVCLTTAAFYFYGFEKGQNADFLQSLTHPIQMMGYFFAFFGAIAEFLGLGSGPPVIWGLVIFGGICCFVIPKIYQHFRTTASLSYFDKMLLGNLLFLSITALLVAVSRSWSSPDLAIPPRYAHYSPYLSAWFYLVGLSVLARRPSTHYWATVWGVGSIAVNMVSHLNHFGDLEYRRDWLRADALNWHNHGVFVQYPPSFNRNIRSVYTQAETRGICRPTIFPATLAPISTFEDNSITLTFQKSVSGIQDASGTSLEKVMRVRDEAPQGGTPFLVLVADKGPLVWIPVHRGRNGYRKMLSGQPLKNPELVAEFMTDNLPVGRFRLGYASGNSLRLTKHRLEVDEDNEITTY